MYGLRIAPRKYQEEFARRLGKHHIKRCAADPQLFVGDEVLCAVHVDDVIFTTMDVEKIYKLFESEFRLKRGAIIGDEWYKFLGKQFRRTADAFEVRIPTGYLQTIFKDLEMTTCKIVPTPSVVGHDLTESPELDEQTHRRYRRVVGKLIWDYQSDQTLRRR